MMIDFVSAYSSIQQINFFPKTKTDAMEVVKYTAHMRKGNIFQDPA